MSGTAPTTIPLEYTTGTGPFFPDGTSTSTGASEAVTSLNGASGDVTLAGDPNFPTQIEVTGESNGDVNLGITPCVGIGAAFPGAPNNGQLFYNTTTSHLYVFSSAAATWLQA